MLCANSAPRGSIKKKKKKLVSLEVDRNMLSLFFNLTHSHDALNKWSVTLVKNNIKTIIKIMARFCTF